MTAGIDVRKRARELILWAFTAARTILENPAEQNVPGTESDEDGDNNPISRALQIIDSTVFQLYLVIGVNPKLVRENVKPATEIARCVLFSELAGIFSYLTSPAPNGTHVLAAQTTHHLMELFTFVASYDPRWFCNSCGICSMPLIGAINLIRWPKTKWSNSRTLSLLTTRIFSENQLTQ